MTVTGRVGVGAKLPAADEAKQSNCVQMLLALAAQAVLPAEWAQLLQQQQAAAGRPAAPAFAQAMQPPQWPFPAQAQQPAQNPMAMMAALMGGAPPMSAAIIAIGFCAGCCACAGKGHCGGCIACAKAGAAGRPAAACCCWRSCAHSAGRTACAASARSICTQLLCLASSAAGSFAPTPTLPVTVTGSVQ